jgi:hypothetical protein
MVGKKHKWAHIIFPERVCLLTRTISRGGLNQTDTDQSECKLAGPKELSEQLGKNKYIPRNKIVQHTCSNAEKVVWQRGYDVSTATKLSAL